MKIDLLVIDPQKDFCQPEVDGFKPALYVPGAEEDMARLATFIRRAGKHLNDIHCTLDSHHLLDIAHPLFWKDSVGNHPNPFDTITYDDVKQCKWVPSIPWEGSYQKAYERAFEYVGTLKDKGRYDLMIWPPHCLIGSEGAMVMPDLFNAFLEWETAPAMINYVTKGSNFWTEHYSGVMAEVPDPNDPSTLLNNELIGTLQKVDFIIIAGEALSHCVANTVNDIADNFGEENIKKFVLFQDCSSPVYGCEQLAKDFVDRMVKRGMQVITSTDFLR